MKIIIFVLLFMCLHISVIAQCKYTISAEISDAETKDIISDANIYIKELNQSTICDAKGYFEFDSICPGHYNILVTHSGCEPITIHAVIKNLNWHQAISVNHAINTLDGVTIKGASSFKFASTSIKGRELESVAGLSLGESLQKINGISSLQTGATIFKPIINGLHSSRLLIYNNGVRQEGQQWGAEHAPEIDVYSSNKITVIKGANAIQYGADAIGGIILVEPKLLTNNTTLSGDINTAIFSNNRMGVLNISTEKASKTKPGLAWRIAGTLKKGGAAKTPNYWLQNTGLQEANINAVAKLSTEKKQTELYYSFFSSQIGIFSGSHIGSVTDLTNAIKNTSPPDGIKNASFSFDIDRPMQKVQHHLLKWKQIYFYKNGSQLQFIVANQYNWRREYDKKKFASSSTSPQLDLGIITTTADILYQLANRNNWIGKIGLQQLYQNNFYNYRLFIPNYQLLNTGIFMIEKLNKKNYNVEIGLRVDNRFLYSVNQNNGVKYSNKTFRNISGNVGFGAIVLKKLTVNTTLSTAWRAPNMNELYSNGLHHGAARIEKGDSNLKPEKAYSLGISANYNSKKMVLDINTYYKKIYDFIFLQPTFPPQLTIRGAFPLFVFKQTNAQLYGADISATYHFTHHLNTEAKMSILYAFNSSASEWLINMPSNKFDLACNYTFNDAKVMKNNYVKVNTKYVAQQTRIPTTGNIEIQQPDSTISIQSDYLAPPNGYFIVGAEFGTQAEWHHKNILLTITASNLLNTQYREYLNAFRYFSDEMGRNISLKIKIPF